LITSTGAVCGKQYRIGAITITPGSNDVTLALDDSTDGAGTVLLNITVDKSVSDDTRIFNFVPALGCLTGFYATVTGTTPKLEFFYY